MGGMLVTGDRLHHLGLHRAPLHRHRAPTRVGAAAGAGGRRPGVRREDVQSCQSQRSRWRSAARFGALAVLAAILALAHVAGRRRRNAGSGPRRPPQAQARLRGRRAAVLLSDDAGKPTGYAVALCQKIADKVKSRARAFHLGVEVGPAQGGRPLPGGAGRQGATFSAAPGDHLDAAARKFDFSLAIFPSGRCDAQRASPVAVREVLDQGQPSWRPIWRGSPARAVLEQQKFSPVAGTISEGWVAERSASSTSPPRWSPSRATRTVSSRSSTAARVCCSATCRSCATPSRTARRRAT